MDFELYARILYAIYAGRPDSGAENHKRNAEKELRTHYVGGKCLSCTGRQNF